MIFQFVAWILSWFRRFFGKAEQLAHEAESKARIASIREESDATVAEHDVRASQLAAELAQTRHETEAAFNSEREVRAVAANARTVAKEAVTRIAQKTPPPRPKVISVPEFED